MTVIGQKFEPRPRILAVNRSRSVRASVDRTVGARYDLQHVGDADSGWQALLNDPTIRAAVVNLTELELDGYNLIQLIRSSRIARIHDLPVVVISTHEQEHADVLIKSLRAVEFVTLDMGGEELAARLAALVEPPRAPIPLKPVQAQPPPEPPVAAVPDAPQPESPYIEKKESEMSRLDNLKRVLKNLQSQSPGVEASALISEDGLMIASALSQDLDDTRVAGMTATLLNLGTRAATELRRGDVKEVIVRGEEGYAVMINAGRGALLLVLASEATPLGLIFFDMREAIKFIKNIL